MCAMLFASRVALLVACLVAAPDAVALTPPPPLPEWAKVKKLVQKKALIVGISNYKSAKPLTSPPIDALTIASTLKKIDPAFSAKVVPPDRVGRKDLLEEIKNFAASLSPGDVAFFFYSGHGVERDNVNYLVPADASLPEPGLEAGQYIPIEHVSNLLREAAAGSIVLVLDACRTDPFAGASDGEMFLKPLASLSPREVEPISTEPNSVGFSTTPVGAGLVEYRSPPPGVIVAYSAASRKQSYSRFEDEPETIASIYTRHLTSVAETLNEPLDQVFGVTSAEIAELTKNWQTPFVSSYSGGQILLQQNDHLAAQEEETWARVASSPASSLRLSLRRFITLYPSSAYADAARKKIAELDGGTTTPFPVAVVASSSAQANSIVFTGALKSASVQAMRETIAIAQRDVFVRTTPSPDTDKIAVIPQGTAVRILGPSERPGWAKVLLSGGKVGYVGSVGAVSVESATAPLTIQVVGSDVATATAAIDETWKKAAVKSTLAIRVSPNSGVNPWLEDQTAFLTALRLRDSALDSGLKPANVMLFLEPTPNPVGAASLSLIREGKL